MLLIHLINLIFEVLRMGFLLTRQKYYLFLNEVSSQQVIITTAWIFTLNFSFETWKMQLLLINEADDYSEIPLMGPPKGQKETALTGELSDHRKTNSIE